MDSETMADRLGYDLSDVPDDEVDGTVEVLAVLEDVLGRNHGPYADPDRYVGRKSPWG